MKRWFFGEKKHLDQEKIEQKANDLRNLRWLLDNGTVEEYVAYVRGMKSDVTANELQTLIAAFHEQRSARRRQRDV
jgi:hypothetical protein